MAHSTVFSRGRVTIVGVLNVTPDSFSDGGRFVAGDGGRVRVTAAVEAALALVDDGADVIDVGGESTRPGARPVPLDQELARTVPILEALARVTQTPLCVDTRKGAVAREALRAGASIVNDVSGGRFDPEILDVVAEAGVTLILGHLRGTPKNMQQNPYFEDVLKEVSEELAQAMAWAERAGVARERLVVDPGIGFGKRLPDNLALLARCGWLGATLDAPVLVGPSRKSFLGALTGDPVDQRQVGTAAACAVALFAGADAIRVHDVAAARRVAAVAHALREAGGAAR